MKAFTLVGVDGNAFAVMGYTARALRKANLDDKINEMYEKAKGGNYHHLIAVCQEYIEMANEAMGLTED